MSPSPCGQPVPAPWSKKGPCRSGPGFDRLPDDIIVRIFNWLDSCELCNITRVCRRFETIAWNPILWKSITIKGGEKKFNNFCNKNIKIKLKFQVK